MKKEVIILSLGFIFLLLSSCGVYEECPGEGGVIEKTEKKV